jgi:hypothetical protein
MESASRRVRNNTSPQPRYRNLRIAQRGRVCCSRAHHKVGGRHRAHGNSSRFRNRFPCTAFVTYSCHRSNTALGPSGRRVGMVLHGTAMSRGEDKSFLALSKSVRRSYYQVSHVFCEQQGFQQGRLTVEVAQRSLVVVECPCRTSSGRYLAPRRALSCIRDTSRMLRFEAVRTGGPPAFADFRTTS